MANYIGLSTPPPPQIEAINWDVETMGRSKEIFKNYERTTAIEGASNNVKGFKEIYIVNRKLPSP